MKKILLLSAFFVAGLLIYKPASAQLRVHVNINPPAWGHYDPYWHRGPDVVLINDRRHGNDGYRDRRDWNRRDWRNDHDRRDDRRHDDRRNDDGYGQHGNGRDDRDNRHDDHRHDDHGRGRWVERWHLS